MANLNMLQMLNRLQMLNSNLVSSVSYDAEVLWHHVLFDMFYGHRNAIQEAVYIKITSMHAWQMVQ